MSINNLIPKNKSDFNAVENIKNASNADIGSVLAEIFEWTEDINWPIAEKLSIELAKRGDLIIPYVENCLNNPNGLMEYAVYYVIMPLFNSSQLLLLKNTLQRIALKPSELEREQEYDKAALKFLEK